MILKNFYSSNLLCICPSLLETNLNNESKISLLRKTVKRRRFLFGREIRLPTPVLLTIHFSAALKPLHLVIYWRFKDLPSHSHGQLAFGDNEKNKMTVKFVFIFIPNSIQFNSILYFTLYKIFT